MNFYSLTLDILPYSLENKSLGHAQEKWLQKAIKNSSYHLSVTIIIPGVQAMLHPYQCFYSYCMLCIKEDKGVELTMLMVTNIVYARVT